MLPVRRLCVALALFALVTSGKQLPSGEATPDDPIIDPKEEGETEGSEAFPSASASASATASVSPQDDQNSLAAALRALRRRKREVAGAHRPYSSYSPLGTHRYRYPLYRKRSTNPAPDYYEDEPYLNPMEAYYDDYYEMEKPSLFRERERGPTRSLISNAHFSSNPIKKTGSSYYNIEDSPYDLDAMGKLYSQGKRAMNSPTRSRNLNASNRLFATLNAINAQRNRLYGDGPDDNVYPNMRPVHIGKHGNVGLSQSSMIRRKRASPLSVREMMAATANNMSTNQSLLNHPLNLKHFSMKQSDRQKRAYDDTPMFFDPKQEDENDFLTREYFKTIARSVGNKRKRMAYAKFEAQKRSNAFDTFLENPKMLNFLQEQIKEAEEEVAKDAEDEIEDNSGTEGDVEADFESQVLLTNSIARLSALERMREALYQLERIQEQEAIQKRAQGLVGANADQDRLTDREKEKRRKALNGRLSKEGQKEEEEERHKRAEAALRGIFKRNRRDECPVLERIVMNCIAVTKMVADDAMVFLEPCLRHEVCYMCGSGLEVTRHECDAILSSALEAGCNDAYVIPNPTNGSLDCLSAAGDTFNLLGDASRYDDKGTCTFDPCVRQLLDSR